MQIGEPAQAYHCQQTSGFLRVFLVGVRMVTNSSAAVGWTPTVASKSALVKPAFTATAKPCPLKPRVLWNFELISVKERDDVKDTDEKV